MNDSVTLVFTPRERIALKAALELVSGDLWRGALSIEGSDLEEVRAISEWCHGWGEGDQPLTVSAPRHYYAVLAAYVGSALTLRGYVVGRPQANDMLVSCYRKLQVAARGEGGLLERIQKTFGFR